MLCLLQTYEVVQFKTAALMHIQLLNYCCRCNINQSSGYNVAAN